MENTTFKSFVVEEDGNQFTRHINTRHLDDLPEGDLLIRVRYSGLNYKDALSATGNKGVTNSYPHTPGIDAVGTVVSSASGKFRKGDRVIVTGYDLGMNTPGGFGQFIRVPSEWALELPDGISMKESMIIGTAGLTAGMSVMRLAEHLRPGDGTVVVSGATGGVGSLGISILAKLGFTVSAVSGKEDDTDFLLALGAREVIPRGDFEKADERPMMKGRFAGGLDTVGGSILENIVKSTQSGGVITCCGNVASPQLHLTVYPFILRGVSLIGINSQSASMDFREMIWEKLSEDWKPGSLTQLCREISYAELSNHIDLMLDGKLKGRTILDLEA